MAHEGVIEGMYRDSNEVKSNCRQVYHAEEASESGHAKVMEQK
jgi:hypothetical protein